MDIRKIPKCYDVTRLRFIHDELVGCGLSAEIVPYSRAGTQYFNLYHRSGPRSDVLITAHWDVVQTGSDNCLDNTGSCHNLFSLVKKLPGDSNVVLAWVDAEEPCNPRINGAVEAVRLLRPKLHLDLELIAGGRNWVVHQHGEFPDIGAFSCPMPPNNARMVWGMRSLYPELLGCACLTIMDDTDIAQIESRGFCDRWSQCHRETDTFDRWLSPEDCDVFVDKLLAVILEKFAAVTT